jgi:hypothetical protein
MVGRAGTELNVTGRAGPIACRVVPLVLFAGRTSTVPDRTNFEADRAGPVPFRAVPVDGRADIEAGKAVPLL